jgi:hypothetical protein
MKMAAVRNEESTTYVPFSEEAPLPLIVWPLHFDQARRIPVYDSFLRPNDTGLLHHVVLRRVFHRQARGPGADPPRASDQGSSPRRAPMEDLRASKEDLVSPPLPADRASAGFARAHASNAWLQEKKSRQFPSPRSCYRLSLCLAIGKSPRNLEKRSNMGRCRVN